MVTEILSDWVRETGKSWVDEVHTVANEGGTWAEAGARFNVPGYLLKAYCHRRKMKFDWQGHRSPVQREHQRRMALDNPSPGRRPKKYRYNGGEYTLKELVELSPVDLTVTTIRFRLYRGLSVTEAVNTPKMENWEKGQKGGFMTGKRYGKAAKRTENNRSFNGSSELHPQANMGGTKRGTLCCQKDHQ